MTVRVAKVISPFGSEEPVLGELSAVFFSGCSLRCSYCQNHRISRGGTGKEYDAAALAELFDGCNGALDLVTPTHFIDGIARATALCKTPRRIIWNTSGYETESNVRRAAAFSDVFLTDLKYADDGLSARFSNARDYAAQAVKAIDIMREKRDVYGAENGKRVIMRGLIIRHLVLPGCAEDSLRVLDTIKSRWGADTVVSLMSQFTPNGVGEPSVRLKKLEYKLVCEHALKLGFKNGYFQDFDSASEKYIPDF